MGFKKEALVGLSWTAGCVIFPPAILAAVPYLTYRYGRIAYHAASEKFDISGLNPLNWIPDRLKPNSARNSQSMQVKQQTGLSPSEFIRIYTDQYRAKVQHGDPRPLQIKKGEASRMNELVDFGQLARDALNTKRIIENGGDLSKMTRPVKMTIAGQQKMVDVPLSWIVAAQRQVGAEYIKIDSETKGGLPPRNVFSSGGKFTTQRSAFSNPKFFRQFANVDNLNGSWTRLSSSTAKLLSNPNVPAQQAQAALLDDPAILNAANWYVHFTAKYMGILAGQGREGALAHKLITSPDPLTHLNNLQILQDGFDLNHIPANVQRGITEGAQLAGATTVYNRAAWAIAKKPEMQTPQLAALLPILERNVAIDIGYLEAGAIINNSQTNAAPQQTAGTAAATQQTAAPAQQQTTFANNGVISAGLPTYGANTSGIYTLTVSNTGQVVGGGNNIPQATQPPTHSPAAAQPSQPAIPVQTTGAPNIFSLPGMTSNGTTPSMFDAAAAAHAKSQETAGKLSETSLAAQALVAGGSPLVTDYVLNREVRKYVHEALAKGGIPGAQVKIQLARSPLLYAQIMGRALGDS